MKNDFLEQVGTADEKYIEEVLEYRSKKITVSKKKLIAIALAAVLGICALSIQSIAAPEAFEDPAVLTDEPGRISTFIPSKHETSYLKYDVPYDSRYTRIEMDENYQAVLDIDSAENFAFNYLEVIRLNDDEGKFSLERGDTVNVRIEIDLEAEGLDDGPVEGAREGIHLTFGRAVGDHLIEIENFQPDDDTDGVLECTYTAPTTGEYEFYIQSGEIPWVHVKSISIEKIS